MSSSSAAMTLRESFGDRKIPDITRKITACVACRKLKIKCHMNDGKTPCSRCKTRGLSCTVNKSLQMLLESDASWKENVEQRIKKLESAFMDEATRKSGTIPTSEPRGVITRTKSAQRPRIPSETEHMVSLNLSCSLGAFPASSIVNVTFNTEQAAYSGKDRPDLISCGVISHDTAEAFFTFYQQHLDPCIHHILSETDTLASTRARSSMLTAAICTVASFCTGSDCYQVCFNAFQSEVSRKLFATKYTFDDVRALCIGAFWLNRISAALNGLAVRIATELNLHRCITKMPHTKLECYDRTRLYFLVYLCDHHCSLSHGRPPLTRDIHSLKSPRDFLQSKHSTRSDLNLISQVELWSIGSRVFDAFGADTDNPVANQRATELDHFRKAYDGWFDEWSDILSFTEEPEMVSRRRILELYLFSAKLYLFSHVFRGLAPQDTDVLTAEGATSFAHSAVESALSIIRCIVDDDGATRPWLDKLPLYFGTMTAFACVCLLRVSCRERTVNQVDPGEILGYLHRLVDVLRESLVVGHPTHPLVSIARSLEMATSSSLPPPRGEANHTDDMDGDFSFDLFTNEGADMGLCRGTDDWMSFLGL